MAIRSEKKKVIQQIVNKDDSSLDVDPESLLGTGDLHWFDVTNKKKDGPKKEDDTGTNEQPVHSL